MMLLMRVWLLFVCLVLLLSGCSVSQNRYILLWHGWNEAETAVLEDALTRFADIHPTIKVVVVAVPPADLRDRYVETAVGGLGPDLFIGSSDWLLPLVTQELVRDIGQTAVDGLTYQPNALTSVTYQDHIYGLPLSLRSAVLYYNTEQVAEPARDLDDLVQQAAAGQAVAIGTRFERVFWGIRTFGSNFFEPQTEEPPQPQQAFVKWLAWLKQVQDEPGMILGRDALVLRQLFVEGKASYYVGEQEELSLLQEALGVEKVGVVRLPSGPSGPSGPILSVEMLYFNPASSSRQQEAALTLGRFLTNAEQGAIFMRETNRVSANRRVRVDSSAFPIVAGFARQVQTAVLPPQDPAWHNVVTQGEELIVTVLAGEEEAGTAVCTFLANIGQSSQVCQ